MPKRYQSVVLEDFVVIHDKQQKNLRVVTQFIKNFKTCLTTGASLIFCGTPGTGKTLLVLNEVQN